MDSSVLIYGANGYTGELIARTAKSRGYTPILAARREAAVRPLAQELGFDHRSFALDDPGAVDEGLRGVRAVLHCAGPFSKTSQPMAAACLRARAHYLDVTGEVAVFEALAARDEEAKRAGVMLLPGVGFDVVPSDCLAAHLKRRLPSASRLRLGFYVELALSRGTATTTVEGIGLPNLVRRDGVLTPVPMGSLARTIDFGDGPKPCMSIPWGDVSTAFYSTGIPDIEVYVALPAAMRFAMTWSGAFAKLLQAAPVQRFLKARAQAGKPGPDAAERARVRSRLWGEVIDPAGTSCTTRLETPEGYSLTIETALASVARVLAGQSAPGFQTPSKLFGPDFILEMPNVVRTDL
jgi:short subunit dehydrogenase-like uncharacterized protein